MHELGYQSSGQSPERSSGETALPAVPLVLSHSGPSPENIAQLAAARIAAAKIRRVVAVANLDGWSTLVLGGIGMIFSLGSPAGFLLGGVMVALGWRQLTAAKNLRRLSIDAPPQLAANQLILCGAISLYAGWNIYTSLTRPSELDPEIQQAIQQYVGSEGSLEAVGYVVVIVGSILIMGSTAWYYRSRSRILADYLAKTPQWILDMQRNGDAPLTLPTTTDANQNPPQLKTLPGVLTSVSMYPTSPPTPDRLYSPPRIRSHLEEENRMSETAITSSMQENRLFPPPPAFSAKARIKSRAEYDKLYRESIDQPETFWGRVAGELHWFKKWDRVLDWKCPDAKWFVGGKTNLAYNCLDRQIELGRGDKPAIIWESELETAPGKGGTIQTLTFKQLHACVGQFANGLKKLGVKKGDRVTIYLPHTPAAAIAMLACARIGAAHSVIFGGFSSQAIADRVEDAQSTVIITADGGYRRGQVVPLKANVDDALKKTPRVTTVIVAEETRQSVPMIANRDVLWSDVVAGQSNDCPAEPMDAEDMLFVLYTSGSTGKPKGIVHTTGGYMAGTYLTSRDVFDLRDEDVYWCTADVGWITGHSYVVYGPLLNGATSFMYEGAPNYPDFSRFWAMIERHGISVFYTAPTAIRAFMRAGRELVDKHDLSCLRLLGSVGEPINPEAWMWYHTVIGHEKCPIVDTWWQTETGAHMITPLPGATTLKPGTATLPFFGIDAAIVDRDGKELGPNQGGLLVIRRPWPSMLRGIFNDPERYQKTYWSDVPGMYFTGDGARRDELGNFWIMGRIDDVLNVSGHRLGTAEVESALVSHPSVAEAAVVGVPHEMKGQAVAAFVVLRNGMQPSDDLKKQLVQAVRKQIGALAQPDQIRFTESLPKTRSGKIMRRLLKEIAGGGEVKGDVTTLEDFNVLAKLREKDEG